MESLTTGISHFADRWNISLMFSNSRTETEEKEVLVRPEWMDKPTEDMSEEERRLVKEFEKKMATFKVVLFILFWG
jgi:hypothetical protein